MAHGRGVGGKRGIGGGSKSHMTSSTKSASSVIPTSGPAGSGGGQTTGKVAKSGGSAGPDVSKTRGATMKTGKGDYC